MGLGARGMHERGECGVLMTSASLNPCAGGSWSYSNVVDIFNVAVGAWSTAVLSQARWNLAATSLPNVGVAIIAGGIRTCCCVLFGFMLQDLFWARGACMSLGSVVL